MAYWKPFESLSAHFRCESQQNMAAGNKMKSPGTMQPEKVASSSYVDVNMKLNTMVHDVWEEIFAHVLRSHPLIMEHLFSTTGSNAEDNLEVKVVKEVFKREMIIALERIYESRLQPNSKKTSTKVFSEENDAMNSLKHSLEDMTRKAMEAEEGLQTAIKEKFELESVYEEYKEEQERAIKMLQDAKEEIDTLKANNVSMENFVTQLNTDIQDLREAKGVEEVKALRSQHDAEMAHLIAKQSVLQAKLLNKQLREAESSSKIVRKQVEELQKVQNEMRSVLCHRPRRSGSQVEGTQNDSPMYRNARPLGQLETTHARRKQRPDGGEAKGRIRTENIRSQGVLMNTEESSPALTAKQARRSDSRNRNAREVNQIMQRRYVRGWRRGAENREGRRSMLHQFLNRGSGAPRNTYREAAGNRGTGRAPWLAGLKRLLSPNSYSETMNPHHPVGAAPNTLEALGENLEALRDVVSLKQKEVDRLRGELRAATLQSDAFERRLRKEQHIRAEMKAGCSGDTGASVAIDTSSDMHRNGEVGKRSSGEEFSRR